MKPTVMSSRSLRQMMSLNPDPEKPSPTHSRDGSSSSTSLSGEARRFKHRASQLIIDIPVARLRRMRQTDGIGSLGRETQHFVGITTLHGPLRIYRGKSYSAWFWAVVMLAAAIFLVYQIAVLVQMFDRKPTVSQVSFLLAENGLEFPMVTICNFNPIRKSYIQLVNQTGDFPAKLLDYLIQTNVEVQALYGNADQAALRMGEDELRSYQANHPNFTVNGFFRAAGFSCPEIMMICSFGGRRFDCCKQTYEVLTNLGKCHTMDLRLGDKAWLKRQTSSGVNSGLQIILDSHMEEQFDGTGDEPEPIFSNAFENGYRYYVHAPETIPYLSSEGISVSPSTRVYSAITSNRFVLLDYDQWGNCTSKWPPEYHSTLPYSSANCLSLCRAKFFYEKCKCSPFIYNIDGALPVCTALQTYQCMKSHIVEKTENGEEMHMPPCDECKVECESWVYHAYNSYGHGFSKGALKWLSHQNPQWSTPHVNMNFLTINVFYRDMSYTEYMQVQGMTITEILSDIGGNMGMFLGMSVITFLEAIIYITKVSWIALSKRRRHYMLDKKKREEEKEREMLDTVTTIKKIRSTTNTSALSGESTQSRLTRLRKQVKESFRKTPISRFNRIRPGAAYGIYRSSSSGSVDRRARERDERRARFMNSFYDKALYGHGRASNASDSSGGSEEPNDQCDNVLELKIDLKKLEHQFSEDGRGRVARAPVSAQIRRDRAETLPASAHPRFYLGRMEEVDETTPAKRKFSRP